MKKSVEKAKELYNQGYSLSQIEELLNITRQTLARRFREDNFEYMNRQNTLRVRPDLFSSIETEEDAYWLGFIYADGYISDKGKFEMSLKYDDYDHLIKFAKYCKFDESKIVRKQKAFCTNCLHKETRNYYRCRMAFATLPIIDNFKKVGIIPRKSLILTYPTFLKDELHRHFIRGYFDGDGTISNQINKSHIRSSIIGTKEFITSLGNQVNIDYRINKKDKRVSGNTYTLSFNNNESFVFLKYMYDNSSIFLNRKKEKYFLAVDKINFINNERSKTVNPGMEIPC